MWNLLLVAALAMGMMAGGAAAEAAADFSKVDEAVEKAIAAGKCPGAVVLVGVGDRVVYRKAYGVRAIEGKEAMTADTIFDMASLTKPMATSAAIMLLVERGKIRLSDPVAKHLPEFAPAGSGKESITILQLLTHQGGLVADNPMSDFAGTPGENLARTLGSKPTTRQGGQGVKMVYSDVGFITLGALVERVSGKTLAEFCAAEVFGPAGMSDTGMGPVAAAKRGRVAPTEKRAGEWMRGDVHDPRAFALGGAAGHAGLFSTADDVSRFARMILGRGAIDGKRVMKVETVADWISPRVIGEGPVKRALGWDVESSFSSPRGAWMRAGVSFGHTGWTGTSLWIDPTFAGGGAYVVVLSSRVHPDGKGDVKRLRYEVATAALAALGAGKREPLPATRGRTPATPGQVLAGIDVLKREEFASLAGRRIAIVTNHTGRDREGNRTVDLLFHAPGVTVVHLFSPEHGIAGTFDEKVGHGVDDVTGLKIYSLYGDTRTPTAEMLKGVDTIVFDIQDIGTRFYTYVSTMGLCMREAKKSGIRMVILDRPNPIGGVRVSGPVADEKHFGFTAFGPIPLIHGMTAGELAGYFNAEMGIGCELVVVKVRGWRREMMFGETGMTWVNPSPNMRNLTQAILYPGVGLVEAANISVGRGTDEPFATIGAPWVDGPRLAAAMNGTGLGGVKFVPIEFVPRSSKFAGQACGGVYVQVTDAGAVDAVAVGVALAWHLRALHGETFEAAKVVRLLQNEKAAAAILAAGSAAEAIEAVRTGAAADVAKFEAARGRYLAY